MKKITEIDIFKELILKVEKGSELMINGFYTGTLSEKNFRKLFSRNDVPKRENFSHYIIDLNTDKIEKITEILNLEGENLINDITHFAIKNDKKFSALSFDHMEMIQIDKSQFKTDKFEFENYNFKEIEINFQEELNDNGFFEW